MTEPAPEKKEAPPPAAPALGELFELSATALVNAPGVFAKLEARPAPGPGAAFVVALAWGAATFGINLLHVAVASPAALQAFEPWKIGAVALLGLGVWTGLFLLGASCVYGLGRALGSAGDFDRALLVAAFALAAGPAAALLSWFPMAWVVPALVGAWILAAGLGALFKADPWAARGVCAVLAAGALAVQYGAGLVVEKYSAAVQLAVAPQTTAAPDQLADLQRQMQQVQGIAEQARQNAANAQAQPQSSLDLLRGPAVDPAPQAPATMKQQIAQATASADAMNKGVLGMLDSMAPMLDNPAITQNMMPAQKADYLELKKMIADLRTGIATNSITSPQEQQAKMMKIQALVMRMMSAGAAMPKTQAAPAPGAKP